MDKVLERYNIHLNIYTYSSYIKISFSIFYLEWLLSCLLIFFLYSTFSLHFCSRHILDQFLINSYLIILLVNFDRFLPLNSSLLFFSSFYISSSLSFPLYFFFSSFRYFLFFFSFFLLSLLTVFWFFSGLLFVFFLPSKIFLLSCFPFFFLSFGYH